MPPQPAAQTTGARGPRKRKPRAKTSSLPDVPWAADGCTLTLNLLSEMEKRENAKVLLAKEKGEVSRNPLGDVIDKLTDRLR